MKKKSKTNKRKKIQKGFTLIEILIVVCIIAILVSVIMVSLMSAKEKAQDNSLFTSLKSLDAPAFACLSSGLNTSLTNLPDPWVAGTNICSNPIPTSDSNWPDLEKYGYTFAWCSLNTTLQASPSSTGPYADGSTGGNNVTGNFCFELSNGSKLMWCTIDGCAKEGF
jgi:prepilin-type N-terminal cleavage/methylation domain-containing protein